MATSRWFFCFGELMSKEEIIAAIKDCAEKLGRTPTIREVCESTGGRLDKGAITRKFGKYTRALAQCGLQRQDKARPRSAMEHFVNWASIVRRLRKVPSYGEFKGESSISERALQRMYKRWSLVQAGMLKFIEREKLEAEWGDVAEIIRQHAMERAKRLPWVAPAGVPSDGNPMETLMAMQTALPMVNTCPPVLEGRTLYGELISHPAMSHAPTSEMGVMVLFGALARDLGFVVMRVQAAFPDCEAMRRMGNGRLQRVLIEFEYDSRNFLEHMHDVKGCDLIVCWKHTWKECPVEVIELSRLFGK
jgi:Homing endonuclease associated repeat